MFVYSVCVTRCELGPYIELTTTPSAPTTPAFSSLAVAMGTQADSRGSLISVDSNPSNSDRNSEKMDGCEKVRGKNIQDTFKFKYIVVCV